MNALLRRRRNPRPLRSVLVRVLVPRLVLFASLAVALLVGHGMSSVDPSATRLAPPSVVPAWSTIDRLAQPDCVPLAQWPAGTPGSALIVHRYSDGATVRMPFMRAWRANHDATETDDLAVLGVCP